MPSSESDDPHRTPPRTNTNNRVERLVFLYHRVHPTYTYGTIYFGVGLLNQHVVAKILLVGV